jgi:hypothetical protein
MAHRLPVSERNDALNMVAWTSAMLGDLPQVVESSVAALALLQPGQDPAYGMNSASWRTYAAALIGRWDDLVAGAERLRNLWLEADRPAASYALQGLLSAIDWARGHGEDDLLQRWRDVAVEIVGRFDSSHPVAALSAVVEVQMDGIADLIGHPDRYPDRRHYVEHAMAICADHAQPVPMEVLDGIIGRAEIDKMRVVEAQGLRLRGILKRDADDLERSLAAFDAMGAARYAARLRTELGQVRGDEALVQAGVRELDAMGELEQLTRLAARRRR